MPRRALRANAIGAGALLLAGLLLFPDVSRADHLLTIPVSDGVHTLGTLYVDDNPGFPVPRVMASFAVNTGTLASTAGIVGRDHFNWYQVVSWSDDAAFDAAGRELEAPYIDPPAGGYGDDRSTSGVDETRWADGLPWYLDEGADPPPGTRGFMDGLNLADNETTGALTLFPIPPRSMPGKTTTHRTWLVALRAGGVDPVWLAGFGWDWNGAQATHIFALCNPPIAGQYDDLLAGARPLRTSGP